MKNCSIYELPSTNCHQGTANGFVCPSVHSTPWFAAPLLRKQVLMVVGPVETLISLLFWYRLYMFWSYHPPIVSKVPSRQLTAHWQLKFHEASDFHLPQSQKCLLGTANGLVSQSVHSNPCLGVFWTPKSDWFLTFRWPLNQSELAYILSDSWVIKFPLAQGLYVFPKELSEIIIWTS